MRRIIPSALAACLAAAVLVTLAQSTLSPPAQARPHSRLAGVAGAGASGLQVVNLDVSQAATVVVDFYKQGGGAPVMVQRPNVGAGRVANIYLPLESSLATGAYAAVVSADREVRAIARTDWNTSGGAVIYEDSIAATDVVVVPAAKSHNGHTSLVTIQNTDTAQQSTVTVDFIVRGSPQPASSKAVSIMPGTSVTIDLDRDTSFASVPPGAIGHLRIRSTTPVAVNAIVDVETSQKGVYAYQGKPVEMAATHLFAPMVHAEAPLDLGNASSPPLTTHIDVVNVDPAAPANVTVTYQGVAGSCAGQAFTQPTITIAAGDSATISQAPAGAILPAGCTAAATIESAGGSILATVVDAQGAGTLAAAYNAQPLGDAGRRVHFPLWRSAHTNGQLSTAVQVMNVGAAPTTATLTMFNNNAAMIEGCGADCTATIPPGGAKLWWPPSIAAQPASAYGTALVEADQPLIAVVRDTSVTGAFDMSSYLGITTDGPSGALPGGPRRHVPILMMGGAIPPPDTPTATLPTAIATATAPPPTAIATATPVSLPTSTSVPPTPIPATATPGAGPGGGPQVSPIVRRRVPPAAINEALAHPERIAGWGKPANPNKPVGPDNPLRTCLTLQNPNQPYHPIFNSLVFKANCP